MDRKLTMFKLTQKERRKLFLFMGISAVGYGGMMYYKKLNKKKTIM